MSKRVHDQAVHTVQNVVQWARLQFPYQFKSLQTKWVVLVLTLLRWRCSAKHFISSSRNPLPYPSRPSQSNRWCSQRKVYSCQWMLFIIIAEHPKTTCPLLLDSILKVQSASTIISKVTLFRYPVLFKHPKRLVCSNRTPSRPRSLNIAVHLLR